MWWLLLALPIVAGFSTSAVESVMSTDNAGGGDPWTRFDGLFQQYGTIYGVDPDVLKAIALNESDLGRAKSVARGLAAPNDIEGSKSSDGKSWGVMQMTLTTARGLDPAATQAMLNNPDYSIRLAAQYVSQLQGMFSSFDPQFLEWVIKSYNQGPGNTKREIANGVGYADAYWARFQRNLDRVEQG
jgi:soluble lytic murein transglycosylase-like protein